MYKKVIETYSPKFQQHIWNDNKNIKGSHNCYSYFLNDINHNLKNIYENENKTTKTKTKDTYENEEDIQERR